MRRFRRFSSAAKAGSFLKTCARTSMGLRAEKPARSTAGGLLLGLAWYSEPVPSRQASAITGARVVQEREIALQILVRKYHLTPPCSHICRLPGIHLSPWHRVTTGFTPAQGKGLARSRGTPSEEPFQEGAVHKFAT